MQQMKTDIAFCPNICLCGRSMPISQIRWHRPILQQSVVDNVLDHFFVRKHSEFEIPATEIVFKARQVELAYPNEVCNVLLFSS